MFGADSHAFPFGNARYDLCRLTVSMYSVFVDRLLAAPDARDMVLSQMSECSRRLEKACWRRADVQQSLEAANDHSIMTPLLFFAELFRPARAQLRFGIYLYSYESEDTSSALACFRSF